MRLLAFSDLHRDRRAAERLVELAQDVEVVVGAGDFATMHHGLESTIEALSAIAVPAVLVPGNAETDVELWQACAATAAPYRELPLGRDSGGPLTARGARGRGPRSPPGQ